MMRVLRSGRGGMGMRVGLRGGGEMWGGREEGREGVVVRDGDTDADNTCFFYCGCGVLRGYH